MSRYFFIGFFILQLGAALWGSIHIIFNNHIFPNHPALKVGLTIAKTGAALINLNSAILLLSMCRAILTWASTGYLGNLIPFGMILPLHRWSASMFIIGSLIHCCAHLYNIFFLAILDGVKWMHPTLITGVLLVLLYTGIGVTSFCYRRWRWRHEVFYYCHLLALPSLGIMISHGLFCFIKNEKRQCTGSTTLYWISLPLLCNFIDQIWCFGRSLKFCYVSKVILLPSYVMEVQMRKPGFVFTPGQFVYVKFPRVSLLQWHPFTLTSAPEEDHISIHARICGDWTRKVKDLLCTGNLEELKVYIDGPYGSASQKHEHYQNIVCIGAGIGQTPFASILKSLWFKINRPMCPLKFHSIKFLGICRNTRSMEWFNDILKALEKSDVEHILQNYLYVTGPVTMEEQSLISAYHDLSLPDPVTGLRLPTQYGRPKFDELFLEWSKASSGKVDVFFCGPPGLAMRVEALCKKYSSELVIFKYYEEIF